MGALRLCPAEGRLQYGAMPLVAQLACTAGSAMQLAPFLSMLTQGYSATGAIRLLAASTAAAANNASLWGIAAGLPPLVPPQRANAVRYAVCYCSS